MARFRIVTAAAAIGAAGIVVAWTPAAAGQARDDKSDLMKVFQYAGIHQSGRLGVSVRDLDTAGGKDTSANGVVVEEVETDSPAAKAGLKAGDVVVEYDGERVRSTRQFTRLVQESVPGRTVPLVVARDGQRSTLNVEPEAGSAFRVFQGGRDGVWAVPPTPPVPPAAPVPPVPPMPPSDLLPEAYGRLERFFGSNARLGVAIQDLSPQLADFFGTKDGVLVTSVTENSAAAKAGVKAGDVITAVNGTTVSSPSDLRRQVQRLSSGDEFTLGIVREKKPLTLKGKVEAPQARRWATTI
jgi:serine protease Do